MSKSLAKSLLGRLPLAVDRVDYADPVLTLSGDRWSLSVVCPWRLTANGELLASLGSDRADVELDQLARSELRVVHADRDLKDPVFEFTDGHRLEIFADTDLDPWVMHVDDLVFVGMGSDP